MSSEIDKARNLWSAVLALGLKEATSIRGIKNIAGEYRDTIHQEVRRWVQSNEDTIGSFVWICKFLDLDPSVTRDKSMKEWR